MNARQLHERSPVRQQDKFSHHDEFAYKELCYKTKAFAEQLAQSMNLIDEKRADYVASLLENIIFYPNDDALIDRALCDLYHSGIREGREHIEHILDTAKNQAKARLSVGF